MEDDLADLRKRRQLKRLVTSGKFHITLASGSSSIDQLPVKAVEELIEIITAIDERLHKEPQPSPEEIAAFRKQQLRKTAEETLRSFLKQDTRKMPIGKTEIVECPVCGGELVISRIHLTQVAARCKTEGCIKIVV